MKICHCIKFTPEEEAAVKIMQRILHEMAEDTMIYHDFEKEKGGQLDEFSEWFDDIVDYLEGFGN